MSSSVVRKQLKDDVISYYSKEGFESVVVPDWLLVNLIKTIQGEWPWPTDEAILAELADDYLRGKLS